MQNVREKIKTILQDEDLSVYWLAHYAKEQNIMCSSTVYKYLGGEIDITSEKRDKLMQILSRRLQKTFVIAYGLDGDLIVKKNVPLIALMESDIA